jgi:hypothetical protein
MPRDVKIRAYRSTVPNSKPPTSGADGITAGEFATNLADKLLFVGASNGGYITYRDESQTVWNVNGKTGNVGLPLATTISPDNLVEFPGTTGIATYFCEHFVISSGGVVKLGTCCDNIPIPCYNPGGYYPAGSSTYFGGVAATFGEDGGLSAFVLDIAGLTEDTSSSRTQYVPFVASNGKTKKIKAEKFLTNMYSVFNSKQSNQLSIFQDTGNDNIDFSIVLGAVAANDQGLVKGASAHQYIALNTVKSINGQTGDVSCIAVTCASQKFSGLQTFVNGISGASAYFSGTDNVVEIIASTNGRGVRIAKSNDTSVDDSGIGYLQFGKRSNETRNWHMGSIGDRNFVFAQGNVGGSPVELLKYIFDAGYGQGGTWRVNDLYNLPDSAGTLGQIIYTDGENLYFGDPPAGGGAGLSGFILRSGDGLTSAIETNNTMTITGGSGILTVKESNDTIAVRGVTATTSALGVASFNSTDFTVSSGAVSLTANVARTNAGATFSGNVFAPNLVNSVNGFTGNVGIPLASAGASGLASFNNSHFTVSATGHVSLASAGSAGTKTYEVFTALDNHPPSVNYAIFDTRGGTHSIGVLEFDGVVQQSSLFVGKIPESASFNNIKVLLSWCFTGTATEPEPSSIVWGVKWERLTTTSLDSESFSSGVTSGLVDTTGVVGGIPQTTTITCPYSSVDGVTAGLVFKLQVYRDSTSADDITTTDMELYAVEVRGD